MVNSSIFKGTSAARVADGGAAIGGASYLSRAHPGPPGKLNGMPESIVSLRSISRSRARTYRHCGLMAGTEA